MRHPVRALVSLLRSPSRTDMVDDSTLDLGIRCAKFAETVEALISEEGGDDSAYTPELRIEGIQLFCEAHEVGAISIKCRRIVERQPGSPLWEVSGMFRAIARRLGYAVPEPSTVVH